jgi:Leucine-rich repeat (LRR) protein
VRLQRKNKYNKKMVKSIKQEIKEFLEANPNYSRKNVYHAYRDYKISSYEYLPSDNKHKLTIDPEPNVNIEKIGDLHPDLQNCLQTKSKITFFWTTEKLNQSDLFDFKGSDDHYWTIFPEEDFIEKSIAQEWLDENYPIKEERKKVVNLDISKQKLEGKLDLSDFIQLERLDCHGNKLTALDVSNCEKLASLRVENN